MAFRCASRSACMAHACPDKYGIRTKGTQSKQKKKSKINKNENFPMASLALPTVLQIASSGV